MLNKKNLNIAIAALILILGIMHWGVYFLVTLFIISFLIFFHELGHFLAAKSLGVCVNVFSIGFGEKIFTKTYKGTEYVISAIPLGGYVSLKGQEDLDPSLRSDDKDSYNSLSPLGRIYILFAGPFFNLIFAFFLYIILGYVGVEKLAPVVGNIMKNSAALEAGLEINDKILKIDGMTINDWEEISKNIKAKTTKLTLQRDGKILDINLTPKIEEKVNIWGEKEKTPLLGIMPKAEFVTIYHTGLNSLNFAFDQTLQASKFIFKGFSKMISGSVAMKDMGGIVAITDLTSKAAQISLSVLITITALISVNLGLINLFPIPALDGGHILFNIYELIFRKPVPKKVFEYLSYAGIALLFTLSLFTIINDFLRLSGVYN